MTIGIVNHLDARDRALFERIFLGPRSRRSVCLGWRVITHAGGFWCSVLAASVPLLACCTIHDVALAATKTLVISHVIVQLLKRTCGRPRPSPANGRGALIAAPDRFSFPSGHACASMAVALSYALAFPTLAVPLIALAMIVGFSRVCLGVHYPGDVLIGQMIAGITAVAIWAA